MKQLLTIAFLLVACISANADPTPTSGTLTSYSYDANDQSGYSSLHVVSIDWVSTTTGAFRIVLPDIHGEIMRVTTNPDDTDAPSANYDVDVNDVDGFDVLVGLGENRSASATESFVPYLGNGTVIDHEVDVAGQLTVEITNAGSAKAGVLRIYIRR